jgi:hypothetical protein
MRKSEVGLLIGRREAEADEAASVGASTGSSEAKLCLSEDVELSS